MVDRPPQPPAQAAAQASAPAGACRTPSGPSVDEAPAVRTVAETFTVTTGTLLIVRLAADLSSATAKAGDRFQGFLDQNLSSDGRLVAPAGRRCTVSSARLTRPAR